MAEKVFRLAKSCLIWLFIIPKNKLIMLKYNGLSLLSLPINDSPNHIIDAFRQTAALAE
jgi:hypothetical protein